MMFMKTSKTYLKYFNFFGFSPIASIHRKVEANKRQMFLFILPIVCHTVFIFVIMAHFALSLNSQLNAYDLNEKIIRNLIIICDTIRTVLSVNQYIFKKSIVLDIIQTFHDLESYFLLHLSHSISYKSLTKRFNKKCTIIAMAFIQYCVISLTICVEHECFNTAIFQFQTMQAVTYLGLLYTAFYVDALAYHIDQLIAVIERDAFRDESHISIIIIANNDKAIRNIIICNKLNDYKNAHFRLWQIGQKISSFFGWHMVLLFLHLFILFVHSAYHITSRIINQSPLIIIWCEYNFSVLLHASYNITNIRHFRSHHKLIEYCDRSLDFS